MTKKEELIIGILKKELIGIKKLLRAQDKQIKEIQKNGFDSEIHPANHIDIRTGLSYTQGYCTGHIKQTESIIELLEMSDAKDIEALLEENRKIEEENKQYLKDIFSDIRKRVKKENKKK